MKKRYLYSALLASFLFIVFYLVINLPLWLTIILAFISYGGGLLLFKEKDVRHYDPNLIMHYCYLISKIDNYANIVIDKNVNKNIKDISRKSEKIVVMLEQKRDKITQVYDGFDYFLPLTIKIIEQYLILEKEKKRSKEEIKFMNDINETLNYIEAAIDKLLENMNLTKMYDINANIEIFKKHNRELEAKVTTEDGDENV